MSVWGGLFALLAAIYLAECAAWVRRNSVVFRALVRKGWQVLHPLEWTGNESGGLATAGPLPPLAPLIHCHLWPVSLSEEGVFAYAAQALRDVGRPRQTARFLKWEQVTEVRLQGKRVLVNGEPLIETGSPVFADRVAGVVEELSELPPERRGKAIRSALREAMDERAIRERMESFREQTLSLRFTCNLFFLVIFGLVPTMLLQPALLQRWPFFLAAVLALLAMVLLDYRRAHRALYPDAKGQRRAHFWMILFSPLAAIRARDVVARDLLANYSPLAVAHVICRPDSFRRFARERLADLRWPMLPVCESDDEDARRTEEAFRGVLLEESERFLRHAGLDPDALSAPPERDGNASAAYCPRCDAQYAVADASCEACGGLPVTRF